MRNLVSCLSEHAVRVSDSSCSGAGKNNISLAVFDHNSFQNLVTYLYKTRLISTSKELFFKVTWSKTNAGQSLSISINDDNTQVLREKEGKRSYKHGGLVISLHWDFSSARYTCCAPDPVDNFYFIVMADSEFALLLGDLSRDYVEMFENTCSSGISIAQFSLVSRKEQVFFTHGVYRTKSRFGDDGKVHEITIKCKGDSWDLKDSGLSVWIDKKKVVLVQRLDWNFRGNQVLFVDGLLVDFMWDLCDWWFGGPSSGCAIFVFRTRSSLESRVWLEEDVLQKEQTFSEFSLLIQAFRTL